MRRRVVILAILLATAVLRLHNLTALGLEHDEVANWLIDRSILDENNYAVYYPAAYGHEAGFHYLQAGSVALIGDNALALRLPAALSGARRRVPQPEHWTSIGTATPVDDPG